MNNHKIRILILDDEPIVCDRLSSILEKNGHPVETFTQSQDALNRLEEQQFQIIISDLKMSGPKGLDVINFAKQQNPAIKAIVITGFATTEMADEAIKAGVVEFIAKPFRLAQIKELVENLVDEITMKIDRTTKS